MSSAGLTQWQLTYEISPIFLVNGIAQNFPGGGPIPISQILQGGSILGYPDSGSLDDYFAHFTVMPGGTLSEYRVGQYPFANQYVAANAIIFDPTRVSLRMTAPARGPGSYFDKLAVLSALKSTIDQHVNLGGTFNVATPARFCTNGIITPGIRDITSMGVDSQQVQAEWEWPFYFPLISSAQAQAAMNSQMSKMQASLPLSGDPPSPSGLNAATGQPSSGVGVSLIPSATPAGGASVGGAPSS